MPERSNNETEEAEYAPANPTPRTIPSEERPMTADEVTRRLGVGLDPAARKAFEKAREEYIDGSDENPSYGDHLTGVK